MVLSRISSGTATIAPIAPHIQPSRAIATNTATVLSEQRRLTKAYCMTVAMLATALVGTSRVYLGVHYPTDVLAGWLLGLSWALLCWMIERSLERRAGLKRERAEAEAKAERETRAK